MNTDFRMRCLALLLAVCLAQPAQAAADRIQADKTAVQAAFLYNFALFTDWPALPEREFNFCVIGDDSMVEALAALKAKQMKDRPIFIRKIDPPRRVQGCQVLFIGIAEHRSIGEIYEQAGTAPVLLVSEEGAYDVQTVFIVLSEQQGRISFRINRTEAAKRSMGFSSKLLKLATQVY